MKNHVYRFEYLYLLIILFLTLNSCNVNATYENREMDKKEAEVVVKKFYKCFLDNTPRATYNLFTKKFLTVTDTLSLVSYYKAIDQQSGKIINYTLADWRSVVVKGTDAHAEYVFSYVVVREKGKTKEKLTLLKEGGNILIQGYDVKGV